MINGQKVLAIIPARGGSKRVPRKNLREFRNRWLVAWTIDAVRGSKYVDDYFISSEDEKVLHAAHSLDYPTMQRPPELATDAALNEEVLRHALSIYPHDWVVLLQPTSPLRITEDIDRAIELAHSNGSACVSFCGSHKNGAVYVASKEWIAEHDFSHTGYSKYFMPEERSLDIDHEEDFAQ